MANLLLSKIRWAKTNDLSLRKMQVDGTADAFNTLNEEVYIGEVVLPDLGSSNPFGGIQ